MAAEASTKQALGGRKTFPFITATVIGVGIGSSATNLGVYLIKQYNVPPVDSALISAIIGGPSNLAPVIGGLISDTCLSCFTVITLGCAAFSLGMILLTLTAWLPFLRPPPCSPGPCRPPAKWQLGIFYAAVTLTTVGVGGTRFTAATMGAAQSDDKRDQAVFFSWYVTGMYISSIIGITGVVFILENVGWITGYGLSAAISVLGLFFFLLGSRHYRKLKPRKSILAKEDLESREVHLAESQSNSVRHGTSSTDGTEIKPGKYHGLSTVIQLVPLMITGTVVSVYVGVQINLAFLQALVMDRHIGPHFSIPIGSLYVFMSVASLVSIPILDHAIYPAYLSLTGKAATPLKRVGVGFAITVLAMAYGALAESKRLGAARSSGEPLSILWLVPCLMLMGLGEALHFPGQLAFFFQEFPPSLKGSATAVIAVQTGIGSFICSGALALIRGSTGWLQNDANKSRMDNVYWMLALTGLLNLGCFLLCAWAYGRKRVT